MAGKKNHRKKKNSRNQPVPVAVRMIPFGLGLLILAGSLYMAWRNNDIPATKLATVEVTLTADPEVKHFKIKTSTYHEVLFKAAGYQRVFRITGFTYPATNLCALKAEVKKGDHVTLTVWADAVAGLEDPVPSGNYISVFGVTRGARSYVDMGKRKQVADRDDRWAYFFALLGVVLLPYGFIKGKPRIDIMNSTAAVAVAALMLVVWLIFFRGKNVPQPCAAVPPAQVSPYLFS